jgi:hypothetical protein
MFKNTILNYKLKNIDVKVVLSFFRMYLSLQDVRRQKHTKNIVG